jgi:hypothetical protein
MASNSTERIKLSPLLGVEDLPDLKPEIDDLLLNL